MKRVFVAGGYGGDDLFFAANGPSDTIDGDAVKDATHADATDLLISVDNTTA